MVHKKHNNLFFKNNPYASLVVQKKCVMCKYIICSGQFHDSKGKTYQVKNHIDRKSSNVVYGVFCKKCNKIVYVGETGVTLYQRLNLSLIRRETNHPVAMHFYTDEHIVEDYSVIGIEKLYKDET